MGRGLWSNRPRLGILAWLGEVCPMAQLIVLNASIITTIVAACQWASKLGAFGASSSAWASEKGPVRVATTLLSVLLWSIWFYF
jgi:ABC-type transporter Mla maintaining outer membrane lipid asymmetry permease subunit MlaE